MHDALPGSRLQNLLQRLGLHRPELRAWVLYDWANSAMVTTIVTAIFPIYFQTVAADGLPPEAATRRFALATTISLLSIAVIAPLLGALADSAPLKKTLLAIFLAIGLLSTAAMFFIYPGDWKLALILFMLADIGASGSFIFYDSLLRHVAREDEIDHVSTTGYAAGYLGGGILLLLNIAWIENPAWFGLPAGENLSPAESTLPARLAFFSVSVWWLLFSIPLFRKVPEPPANSLHSLRNWSQLARNTTSRLLTTARQLRSYKHALLMLLAFLAYNDGIGTIIRLATIYGAEINIDRGSLIQSILIVQFVGIPCSILFGSLAGVIGTKRAIFLGISVYFAIAALAYFLRTGTQFFLLAILVGLVQGGTQALSRSLFASLIPRRQSAEFFALFSLGEKFAGILGPALFAATSWLTGNSRTAILSVVFFFLLGGFLLTFVNVEEGRRYARSLDDHSPP